MSLFSRIGDMASAAGHSVVNDMGVIWGAAKAISPGDSYGWSDFMKTYQAGVASDQQDVPALATASDEVGAGLHAAYTRVNKGGGMGIQAIGDVLTHGYVTKDDTQKMTDRNLTYGQALVGQTHAGANLDNVQQKATTEWGIPRLASGTADALVSWYADPTVIGGKAFTAARAASKAVKGGDLAAGAAAKAGTAGADLSLRQKVVNNKFDHLVQYTRGMSSGELMQTSWLKDNEAGDTIASLIGDVNKAHPDDLATRDAKVADVLRASLGDKTTLDRMVAENSMESHRIQNMTDQLDYLEQSAKKGFELQEVAPGRFRPVPVDKSAIEAKTAQVKQELSARREYQQTLDKFTNKDSGVFGRLGTELPAYDTLGDRYRLGKYHGTGRSTQVGVKNRILPQGTGNPVRRFLSQDGLTSTPVQLLDFVAGARPAGVVQFHDGADLNAQVGHLLDRVKGLEPEQRDKLASMVANANNDGARSVAVQQMEHQIFNHIAKQALGPQADEKTIQNLLKDWRQAHSSAKQKMWGSSGDEHYASQVDPSTGRRADLFPDGEGNFYAKPLTSSQLANSHPLIDTDEIYRALRANRSQILAHAQSGLDVADSILGSGIKLWKFGKLARVGYPLRNTADAQVRMMTVLGASDYIRTVATGVKNSAVKRAGGTAAKQGFGVEKIKGYDIKGFHGSTDEELAQSLHAIAPDTSFLNQMGLEASKIGKELRSNGKGRVFHAEEDPAAHADAWLHAANNQLRQSPEVQYFLENGAQKTKGWLKATPEGRAIAQRMRPIYHDDYDEMVSKIDQLVESVTGGNPVIRGIMRDRNLSEADLKTAWPNAADRPMVHGTMADDALHKGPAAQLGNKIMEGFYKWTADIPEGLLARHPLAVQLYRRHVTGLIDAAEAGEHGTLSADDIDRIRTAAVGLARRDMKRTLYNIASQPNLSHGIWKFIFPFFSAFEDVAVKYGKLVFDDPSRAARMAQVWNAPNKAGIAVDAQGNVVAPGKGISDSEFILLPKVVSRKIPLVGNYIDWRVSKSSANIVLQGDPWFLPGFGPIVGLSANEVSKRYPQTEQLFEKTGILPFGTAPSSVDQISPLPTWGTRLLQAARPSNQEHQQVFAELLAAEHMAINNGTRKDPGEQKLLDEVGHKTAAWFLARAVASFGLPVSAGPMTKYQFYFDEAHRYQDPTKNAALLNRTINGQKVTLTPEEAFYTDYPKYFEAMTSLSQNNTGIKSTLQGVAAAKKWSKEIAAHPEYGSLFVGPDDEGTYSGAARAWELNTSVSPGSNTKFRSFKDPQEALKSVNAEKGWIQYRKVSDQIEAMRIQQGFSSLNSAGAEDLKSLKDMYVQHLEQTNQDWRDDYLSRDSGKVTRFLEAANTAVTSPKAKGRTDLDGLRQYLQYRGQVQQLLQQRKAAGGSASLTATSNQDVAQMMDLVVGHLKEKYLTFSDIYDRNLQADDLTAPQP